jgi:hypothetical protein
MTPMSESNAYVSCAPETPFHALDLFDDAFVVIWRSTALFERPAGEV